MIVRFGPLKRFFYRYGYAVPMALVFPPKCYACGALFYRPQSYILPGTPPDTGVARPLSQAVLTGIYTALVHPFLCDDCLKKIKTDNRYHCVRCGIRFESLHTDDHLCGVCLRNPGKVTKARSVAAFDSPLAQCIRALKYQRKTALARPLGLMLFMQFLAFCESLAPGETPEIVIPVPLHKTKKRQRGFNQAELLVQHWHRYQQKYGDASNDRFRVDTKVLSRRINTPPQVGSTHAQRKKNLKNAFRVRPGAVLTGRHILLVDDVYTTGATLESCALALIKGGAARVDALTVLRVS